MGETLVAVGGNPVYNAPADVDFAKGLERVPTVIRLSLFVDETSEKANWHLPQAHYLESWGDARTADGTVVPVQPMILPLFGGLFTYKTRSRTKTNLMVFLRPTVLRDAQRAQSLTDDRYNYILGEQARSKPPASAPLPDMEAPSLPSPAARAPGLPLPVMQEPPPAPYPSQAPQ
jgi:anaerobic selenocysteine-containing dehydrogenase